MFGVLYVCGMGSLTTQQSIPPLLPFLIPDLGLSYAQAGSMMSLFALPGLALAIPVGLWADRQGGSKRILTLCMVAIIIGGLIVAVAPSYPVILAGRLIAGAGSMSLTVMLSRSTLVWFVGKELGLAIGLFTSVFAFSTVLSLTFLGELARSAGWHFAALVGPALAFLALIALLKLHRPAPQSQATGTRRQEANQRSLRSKARAVGVPVWLLGLVWMWYNAGVVAFLTFGPVFFNDRGYGLAFAGLMTSIQVIATPIVAPMAGLLLDRYPRPELVISVAASISALAIISVPFVPEYVLAPLVVLSITSALIPTTSMFLVGQVARPGLTGLAYGINSTGHAASFVLGPYLAGLALDTTGSYEPAFALMAGFAILCAATTLAVKVFRWREADASSAAARSSELA